MFVFRNLLFALFVLVGAFLMAFVALVFVLWGPMTACVIGVAILAIAVIWNALRKRPSDRDVGIDPGAPLVFPGRDSIRPIDRHVRFTVYRPDRVRPAVWNTMLAFAYRGGDDEEGAADIKASFEEVERQARAVLGPQIQEFDSVTTENRREIPRGKTLRFVPRVDGLEFKPPERPFLWVEKIHQEVFRFRAPKRLDGKVVHGRMEVYIGVILIGEVGLTIGVDSSVRVIQTDPKTAETGRPYRKIFASYSHKDLSVVMHFRVFADAVGDEFMRDWTHLRVGQIWSEELQSMIFDADVFQLFWSTNSMESEFVRQEWEYALKLGRPSFIRPVYWEEPMPERPDIDLPPEPLRALHFHQLSPLGRRRRLPRTLRAPATIAGLTPIPLK
jgi:hypothetical protein